MLGLAFYGRGAKHCKHHEAKALEFAEKSVNNHVEETNPEIMFFLECHLQAMQHFELCEESCRMCPAEHYNHQRKFLIDASVKGFVSDWDRRMKGLH